MALLGIVGDASPYQRYQTVSLFLDEAGEAPLQLEVPQQLEGPLCHFEGIGEAQYPAIRLALQGKRIEAVTGQMGLDGGYRLLIVGLWQHLQLDEGDLIHRGDDAGSAGAGARRRMWVQPSSGL